MKLGPILWEAHKNMHESYFLYNNFYEYYKNNDLVTARFTHLAELVLERKYLEGIDYESLLLKEFKGKLNKVGGTDIRIWEGVDDNILREWIHRWIDKKTHTEK